MDYRLTQYETFDFLSLEKEKKKISDIIDERVRQLKNRGQHYQKINFKKGPYYNLFSAAYNSKCAYCGVDTRINPTTLFEVDHFINEIQKVLPNGTSVNDIGNLVFSCRRCNQAKDAFNTSNIYDILHPDHAPVLNVFVRTEKYGISIQKEYCENLDVIGFFKKLHLDSNFKRLDFLLMNLRDMENLSSKDDLRNVILSLYTDLLELRNKTI